MVTSGYQVLDLDDTEFYWQIDQLEVDAASRAGIDTPCSPTAIDDLEMEASEENPILLDDEDHKENFLRTSVSGRPSRPLHC